MVDPTSDNPTVAGAAATGRPAAALRVVEISDGIMAAYAGWLLAQMGAEVAHAVAGGAMADADAGPNALARARDYLNHGKTPLPRAGLAAALADADIVITDDLAALEALAGATLDALAAARSGAGVFGVASIFGLSGELARLPATPLDAQAMASVAWALGEPGRAPLSIPPGVLECQAGAHLAAACLMARYAGRPGESGQIVDIALADVLAGYVAVNCRFYIHHGMRWQRAGRRASDSGGAYPFVILPCRDGAVCLSGRTRAEWERFVEAMGAPAWSREPRYQKLRAMGQQYPDEVDALITPWLGQHSKAEIAAIADQYRLTIAPLRDFAEVLATPQLAHRLFLRPWVQDGRTLLGPGLPFRATARRGASPQPDFAPQLLAKADAGPASGTRAAGRTPPLAGLRVLDLGWVWSAPQVGSILAQLGAEVIKVEHAQRPDNSRLSGVIIRDGKRIEGQTTDMSPMFHQINKGKLGVTLNLKTPEGVDLLKRLAAVSDIVLENMSAGTMERSGLGYDTLVATNPRLIMVAMSGAGQFGPLADMRTYAPTMSSFVGLEALVGYANEPPCGALNFAIGDPNAAAHALVALFAALARRDATATGCYLDLSQTEALLATLTPYLLQAQIDGVQPPPMGNAHPAMAPHGIYPAAGEDRWISLAAATDRQWAALTGLAPAQEFAADPRFATSAGRIAGRTALDQALSRWTATIERDALVVMLRGAGIPAAPVNDIAAFFAAPHFAARGLGGPAELPGLGPEILFRVPWTISGVEFPAGTRGPVIGEHNAPVLQGILGLSAEEFSRLTTSGVIA